VIHRSNYLRLGLLALIWGSSFLFIKVGLEGLAPEQVVVGRVGVGALILVVVATLRGLRLPVSPGLWGHLAVVAIVGNLVPFSLFAWGETHIDSSLAGILNAATPLFTLLMALALLPGEIVTRPRVLGLFIGFAGVVIIVGPAPAATSHSCGPPHNSSWRRRSQWQWRRWWRTTRWS
jgi:drug/metabolite transporter (DMT)-like permease